MLELQNREWCPKSELLEGVDIQNICLATQIQDTTQSGVVSQFEIFVAPESRTLLAWLRGIWKPSGERITIKMTPRRDSVRKKRAHH